MSFYLTVLFITIAVEYVVYVLFFRKDFLSLFFYAILINLFTHPLAYYFYNYLTSPESSSAFNVYFLIVELVVFLTETVLIMILFRIDLKKAVLLSFLSNIATALLSFAV